MPTMEENTKAMLGELAFMMVAHKTASETLAQQVSALTAKIEAAKPKPPAPAAETPATTGDDGRRRQGRARPQTEASRGPRLISDP
jgi:uncharacterized coiled-coil protein SlyX